MQYSVCAVILPECYSYYTSVYEVTLSGKLGSTTGSVVQHHNTYTLFKISRKLDVTVIILWFPLPIAECYPCLFISNNPVVLCSNVLHVGIRYKWSCVGCRSVLSREPGSAARTCCVRSDVRHKTAAAVATHPLLPLPH